jgi:hypothetical protein
MLNLHLQAESQHVFKEDKIFKSTESDLGIFPFKKYPSFLLRKFWGAGGGGVSGKGGGGGREENDPSLVCTYQ